MRKVLVVGAGQSGLHLAHGLLDHGYDVTLITGQTSTEIRTGRPAVTQFTLPTVLSYEQEHHLDFWAATAPRMEEFNVSLYPPGGPGLSLKGSFEGYATSIDRRVKMADWLEYFEDRGGKVVIHGVTVTDLDYFSRMFDLVVIAVGAGELGGLFDGDRNRFSGARNRILTQAHLYDVNSDPQAKEDIGWVASTSDAGDIFLVPILSAQGPCHSLFVIDKPGGPMDLSVHSREGRESSEELLLRMKGLLRRYAPEYYERCKNGTLIDGNSTLVEEVHPQVRSPVGVLPSGGLVLGIADVVVSSDPIGGQGWNNSTRCAESYLASILEHGDRPFDRETLSGMFERFWEYGQHAELFVQTIASVGEHEPPEHFQEFLGAAATYQEIADRWVRGWDYPPDYGNWLFDPDLTRRYLSEVRSRHS